MRSFKVFADPLQRDGSYWRTCFYNLPVGHDDAIYDCPEVVRHEWRMCMNAYTANMNVWIDELNEESAQHVVWEIFENMSYPTEQRHGSQAEWEAVIANMDLGDYESRDD